MSTHRYASTGAEAMSSSGGRRLLAHPLLWAVLASLALHGLVWLYRPTVPTAATAQPFQWIARLVRQPPPPPTALPSPPVFAAQPQSRPVPTQTKKAAAAEVAKAPSPPSPQVEARPKAPALGKIAGSVFGIPRIATPFGLPPSSPITAPRPQQPDLAQLQAMRAQQESRAQFKQQLVTRMAVLPSEWPPPSDGQPGQCLWGEPHLTLHCTTPGLSQALETPSATWAPLLRAWQSQDSRVEGFEVAYEAGQYRISVKLAPESAR